MLIVVLVVQVVLLVFLVVVFDVNTLRLQRLEHRTMVTLYNNGKKIVQLKIVGKVVLIKMVSLLS